MRGCEVNLYNFKGSQTRAAEQLSYRRENLTYQHNWTSDPFWSLLYAHVVCSDIYCHYSTFHNFWVIQAWQHVSLLRAILNDFWGATEQPTEMLSCDDISLSTSLSISPSLTFFSRHNKHVLFSCTRIAVFCFEVGDLLVTLVTRSWANQTKRA